MRIPISITIALAVLTLPPALHAQAPYACVTKGATLEYANYNEADRLQGYTRRDIVEVSDLSGGNYDLRIENSGSRMPHARNTTSRSSTTTGTNNQRL